MARIESEAVGKGRGSMGNLTYRYVRGQTVASRRITSNSSSTKLQVKQRKGFGSIAHMAKALRSLLLVGLVHSRDSRVDNLFMHYNKPLMEYIKRSAEYDVRLPSVTNLCIALSDNAFDDKVLVANGSVLLIPTYEWDSMSNIGGTVYASRPYVAGDVLTLGVCYSYVLVGSYFEMIDLYQKRLTEEDIDQLPYNNQFRITRQAFPTMNIFGKLPPGFSDVEILVSTILTGEKDSSESYLSPMPDMAPQFHIASQTFNDDKHMRLVVDNPKGFAAEIGERALSCSFVFIEDMEYENFRRFKVDSLSKDTKEQVNGIIVSPPGSGVYITSEYPARDDAYSLLLKDDEVVAVFSGVASLPLLD